MQSMLNEQPRQELHLRINLLQSKDKAQWGKIDAWQMLRHVRI